MFNIPLEENTLHGFLIVFGVGIFFYLKDRIAGIKYCWFTAELQKLQEIRKEIKEIYIDMGSMYISLMENRRWSGWSETRCNEEIERVKVKCNKMQLSENEQNKIFQAKIIWDKIDQIVPIKKQIERGLSTEQIKKINAEWEHIIEDTKLPSAVFLEPYLNNSSLKGDEKLNIHLKIKELS